MSGQIADEQKPLSIMRSPRKVDVEITARCNLHCRYCYFFENPQIQYRDLPTDQWLQFFAELGRCAVMQVSIGGGEPLLRRDLPELIAAIVENRMRFTILSNGLLVDDKIAATIAASGRCDQVQISLDGSKPETHDVNRGKGSFAKAVRAIAILRQHRIPVTVRTTIHRHNIDDLENIARLLLEEMALPSFSTNSAGYLGVCRRNAEDILLTTEERNRAMAKLVALAAKYPGRIQALAGPLAEARQWRRMQQAKRQKAAAPNGGGYLSACGCPASIIAVRHDGAFVPCSLLAHIELGWINRDSLLEVWHGSQLNQFRNRCRIPLSRFDFCRDCPYLSYCTGNCPGMAYGLTGEVNHPSPDACLRRFLAQGGALPPLVEEEI